MIDEEKNASELTQEQLDKKEIEATDIPQVGSFYSSLQVASILLKFMRHIELNAAEKALYEILQYQRYEEVLQSDKVVGIRITE